jgi:hypothetical protein
MNLPAVLAARGQSLGSDPRLVGATAGTIRLRAARGQSLGSDPWLVEVADGTTRSEGTPCR